MGNCEEMMKKQQRDKIKEIEDHLDWILHKKAYGSSYHHNCVYDAKALQAINQEPIVQPCLV